MELAKQPEQNRSTAVEKVSQNAIVQKLAAKNFKEASNNLPKKIQQTFDLPKVREMVLAAGEKTVQGFIEFELIKLAERINVSGNLTDGQVEFIASQLLGLFPNETIADFKICFEKGSTGVYGKIWKLDGVEIGNWMKLYLEEKYQVLETELMREKDQIWNRKKSDTDWLQLWKESIEKTDSEGGPEKTPSRNIAFLQHLRSLSPKETAKYGQEKPPREAPYPHNDPETLAVQMGRQKLLRAASEFYKDRRSVNLQKFEVEGIEFGAENKEDAEEIYKRATES
jgi:hypothetical protein